MTFHRGYRPRQKLILAKGWGVPPPTLPCLSMRKRPK